LSSRSAVHRAVAVGAVVVLAGLAPGASAAEPSPTPLGGDPRSAGEAPGFVGDPFTAVAVVLGIALIAIVVTLAWVRLTDRRGRSSPRRP
jgi:hypothetical protein